MAYTKQGDVSLEGYISLEVDVGKDIRSRMHDAGGLVTRTIISTCSDVPNNRLNDFPALLRSKESLNRKIEKVAG